MKTEIIQYACHQCGKIHEMPAIRIADETMKNEVLHTEIFQTRCPSCNAENAIYYPMAYISRTDRYLIQLVNPSEESADPVSEFLEEFDPEEKEELLKNYEIRTVINSNQLAEKIMIFDQQRDDHVIELCKVILKGSLMNQYPGLKVKNLYYSFLAGQKEAQLSIETDDGFGQAVQLLEELYEGILSDAIPKLPEKLRHTREVDEDWAFAAMGYDPYAKPSQS